MVLRLILTLALTLVVSARFNKAPRVIRIACLLPKDDSWMFSINRVRPAIQIAIDKVTLPGGLLGGHEIEVEFSDSNCDSAPSMNEAIRFYIYNKNHVFFGPCCDYAAVAVAHQATYWNIPIITQNLARDFAIARRTRFSTLTRIGGSINKLADVVSILMHQFRWQQMKLFYDPNSQDTYMKSMCHLVADGFHYLFTESNFFTPYYKFENLTKGLEDMADQIGTRYAEAFHDREF